MRMSRGGRVVVFSYFSVDCFLPYFVFAALQFLLSPSATRKPRESKGILTTRKKEECE
jgi:hypothetical protein